MRAFRVADRRHEIFSASGAMLHGGRWNSPGNGVIYAAEIYAGALLEVLVHANLGVVPRNHGVVTLVIPEDLPFETLAPGSLPGWSSEDQLASRRFGDLWLKQRRTPVLLVPSVVLQGRERNILLNPHHPGFQRIIAGEAETVIWDARLFPQRATSSAG